MKVAAARAKLRKVTGSQHSSIMEIKKGVMFTAESPFSVTFATSGNTRTSKPHESGQGHCLKVVAQLSDTLIANISPA